MAYPSFTQQKGSKKVPMTAMVVDQAQNLTLRKRVLSSAEVYSFTIHHILTSTDRDTLMSHYWANLDTTFSFTWSGDSTAYTVAYIQPPTEEFIGGNYWHVTTTMRTTS